jgi:hypothetical protein
VDDGRETGSCPFIARVGVDVRAGCGCGVEFAGTDVVVGVDAEG